MIYLFPRSRSSSSIGQIPCWSLGCRWSTGGGRVQIQQSLKYPMSCQHQKISTLRNGRLISYMKQWLESLFFILLGASSQDSLCSSLDRARGHMVLFKLYLATVWNTRYYGANKSFLWEDILWRFPGCFFAVWSKEFVWKMLMFQVLIDFLKVKEFEPKSNFFPFVALEYGIMNHQSLQNQHFNQLSTWWKLGCPHILSIQSMTRRQWL